jgi:uncharacterized membrane protein
MKQHDTPEKNYDLERLIFFSDGVFAIAITLLVIELHPPHDWDRTFTGLVNHLGASIIYYMISFAAIGAFWMTHRLMFRYVQGFSETASWLNLLFLALVGLTPLANMLLGTGRLSLEIIWIYIGLMSAISLAGGVLWAYLSMASGTVDPRLSTGFKWAMLVRLSIMPPIMCGASLWVGVNFGLWPAAVFVAVIVFLSTLIRSKPFPVEAPAQAD